MAQACSTLQLLLLPERLWMRGGAQTPSAARLPQRRASHCFRQQLRTCQALATGSQRMLTWWLLTSVSGIVSVLPSRRPIWTCMAAQFSKGHARVPAHKPSVALYHLLHSVSARGTGSSCETVRDGAIRTQTLAPPCSLGLGWAGCQEPGGERHLGHALLRLEALLRRRAAQDVQAQRQRGRRLQRLPAPLERVHVRRPPAGALGSACHQPGGCRVPPAAHSSHAVRWAAPLWRLQALAGDLQATHSQLRTQCTHQGLAPGLGQHANPPLHLLCLQMGACLQTAGKGLDQSLPGEAA